MKNKIARFTMEILFLAVFNTLFFVICGTENSTSIWISYGFIHLSYLCILITPYFKRGTKGLSILGTTLYSISFFYFFVELLTGILLMYFQLESKWALLIQVILFGLFLLVFLSSFMANESTKESIATSQNEASYIKDNAYQLKIVLQQIKDRNAYKKVERCYDLLHGSPTKSILKVKGMEVEICSKIEELKKAVSSNNWDQINQLTDDLSKKIEERNQCLRFTNNNN